MLTSRIFKNFIILGQKQVKLFVDAIEDSTNNRPVRTPVEDKELTDTNEVNICKYLENNKSKLEENILS